MLQERIKADYEEFLSPFLRNTPTLDGQISNIDWASFLKDFDTECQDYAYWWHQPGFMLSRKEPPRPLRLSIKMVCSEFDSDEIDLKEVFLEIQSYVDRKAGRISQPETEVDALGFWCDRADRIVKDLKLIDIIFDGNLLLQAELRRAVEDYRDAYYSYCADYVPEGRALWRINERAEARKKTCGWMTDFTKA